MTALSARVGQLRAALPNPVIQRIRRARGILRNARIEIEDARVRLGTPRATRTVALGESALDAVIARNSFGVYCVPLSSRGIVARTVRRGNVWEQNTLELIRRVSGDVVHAGTFFGDFLPGLASSRESTIWAFEPGRENYRCANITTLLNGLDNVVLTHGALSDEPGNGFLTSGAVPGIPSGGASKLAFGSDFLRSREPVPLLTIDEAIPNDRHVGVLHLDIEGHEVQALTGGLQTISRCQPLVVVESVPSADWLGQFMPGYRVSGRVDQNTVLAPGGRAPTPTRLKGVLR